MEKNKIWIIGYFQLQFSNGKYRMIWIRLNIGMDRLEYNTLNFGFKTKSAILRWNQLLHKNFKGLIMNV